MGSVACTVGANIQNILKNSLTTPFFNFFSKWSDNLKDMALIQVCLAGNSSIK